MSLFNGQIVAAHEPATTLFDIKVVRFWLDVPPQLIVTVRKSMYYYFFPNIMSVKVFFVCVRENAILIFLGVQICRQSKCNLVIYF